MAAFQVDDNRREHIDGMTIAFPYCMHERDLTDFVVPWHWHEELELGYMEKGTSMIQTLDRDYRIHQGDGFFINTNVVDSKHNAKPGAAALEINHIFHPVFLGGHFGSRITEKYIAPVLHDQRISVHLIRRGTRESDEILDRLAELKEMNRHAANEMLIRNALSEVWLLLLEDLRRHFTASAPVNTQRQERMKAMLSFIHGHYEEKITLAMIAGAASISQREANRTFQESIHKTPFSYLMDYRLQKARELLKTSELSITQISYQCGFSDSTFMGRQFRKAYGKSPSHFRSE